ncbi:MAG: ATP-binding protein [Anaerolineae bacterium]|nr:ATP-binding protein [Anaerolineae bacterium]
MSPSTARRIIPFISPQKRVEAALVTDKQSEPLSLPRLGPDGEPWCDTCRSVRSLYAPDPAGRPGRGKIVPCPACGVVLKRQIERMQRYSSLSGQAREQRFGNFSCQGRANAATPAFNAAVQFAGDPRGWLVLYGGVGCGKSHLAAAIVYHLIHTRCIPALFLTAPSLLEAIKATFGAEGDGRAPDDHQLIRLAQDAPVLVLDDLGAEYPSAWSENVLYLILDHRYRNEMPTVIVSNLHPKDLPARLASRIQDRVLSRVVFNPAPDYRPGV